MFVMMDREAVLCGHSVLQLFDFGRFELDDLSAARADQMIVVAVAVEVFMKLIQRRSLAELALLGHSPLAQ
jgi:hypothetical protein